MPFEYMDLMENLVETILSFGGISSLLGVVSYVFCGVALYTIAQRRGIKMPWLAWIPVVNVWILGSLSDQYRYVVRGEVKNKRKVLLTVSILQFLAGTVASIKLIVNLALAVSGVARGCDEMEVIRWLLSGLAFYIPSLILSVVALVYEILALYDVYTSCEPENNVLYLILSIVPGLGQITKPLFLFLCRDQDRGMPPRRETPEYL